MNERMTYIPLPAVYPGASAALGDNYAYIDCIQGFTIVGVTAAPSADDTGLTLDINDDGSAAISAISCADADVPGTWKSTHVGGTNTPVHVDAGSKLSFDANSAANGTQIMGYLLVITDEVFS